MQNKIQQFRWEQNISLHQLAQKSGVSEATIWRIENNEVVPSILNAHLISKALGKNIYEVFLLK